LHPANSPAETRRHSANRENRVGDGFALRETTAARLFGRRGVDGGSEMGCIGARSRGLMAGVTPARGEFVSEAIDPVPGTFDAAAMSRGEPGLPRAFHWRGRRYDVAAVCSTWKSSSRERGELYLRRHWYEVASSDGSRMTLYCERQTKNRNKPKARWWLYSIARASAPPTGPAPVE
jgi:hypothetical protein